MPVAQESVKSRSQPVLTLADLIPPYVAWVSRKQGLEVLGLRDDSSLRRDQAVLLYLETPGFDYQPHQRGFTWDSLNVLWEFRKLVNQQGRARAIAQINKIMGEIYESSRFESSAAS